MSQPPPRSGDDLVPDASMVFDRARDIPATPEQLWPWLVQLGKHRAGWYLPCAVERVIPPGRRAIRRIEPRWQQLAVGDAIPDYGGRSAQLHLVQLRAPELLVYRDERRGARFSWAIILTPIGPQHTRVSLRFRGALNSTGLRRRLIITAGGLFDGLTGEAMLRGLQERALSRSRA